MNDLFVLLDFHYDDYKILKNNILINTLELDNHDKLSRNMLDIFCSVLKTKLETKI